MQTPFDAVKLESTDAPNGSRRGGSAEPFHRSRPARRIRPSPSTTTVTSMSLPAASSVTTARSSSTGVHSRAELRRERLREPGDRLPCQPTLRASPDVGSICSNDRDHAVESEVHPSVVGGQEIGADEADEPTADHRRPDEALACAQDLLGGEREPAAAESISPSIESSTVVDKATPLGSARPRSRCAGGGRSASVAGSNVAGSTGDPCDSVVQPRSAIAGSFTRRSVWFVDTSTGLLRACRATLRQPSRTRTRGRRGEVLWRPPLATHAHVLDSAS